MEHPAPKIETDIGAGGEWDANWRAAKAQRRFCIRAILGDPAVAQRVQRRLKKRVHVTPKDANRVVNGFARD